MYGHYFTLSFLVLFFGMSLYTVFLAYHCTRYFLVSIYVCMSSYISIYVCMSLSTTVCECLCSKHG